MPTSGRSETASHAGCSVTPFRENVGSWHKATGRMMMTEWSLSGEADMHCGTASTASVADDPRRHRRANFSFMHNAALHPANLITGSLPCQGAFNAPLFTFPHAP